MNIKEAKEEIMRTVRAYLQKDGTGAYRIPREKQRPVLLMGPPGIGKTAIMEQIAAEMRINLVAYTITHHTRQSAIGLPFISRKSYGGQEYAVTEYTMSEIVAAVYEQMERSGVGEGILFLDEINCVSETLAPAMLQLLQYKRFGMHAIPEGFVLVTAGNPAEYNRSVRDFDIVTLDRVKRMDVSEDLAVFQEYAVRMGVHGAVLAYLEIHKDHFYSIRQDLEGRRFVTARGWEDLSSILKVYEELGLPVSESLAAGYLEDPEIARSFATYYALYQRYRDEYHVPEILSGKLPGDKTQILRAPFDEKLSLLSLLADALMQECREYRSSLAVQQGLFEILKSVEPAKRQETGAGAAGNADLAEGKPGVLQETGARALRENQAETLPDALSAAADREELLWKKREEAHILSREEAMQRRVLVSELRALSEKCLLEGTGDWGSDYAIARAWFSEKEAKRQAHIQETGEHLSHALLYIDYIFGEGQEMVLFLSELSKSLDFLGFVSDCGNEAYYRYNHFLLLHDQRDSLRQEARRMLSL